MRRWLIWVGLLLGGVTGVGSCQGLVTNALRLQQAPLADVILLLAKLLNMNVMLSPAITGVVNLQLSHANVEATLNLLLQTHGLAKWQHAAITYIGPYQELSHRAKAYAGWQENNQMLLPLQTSLWPARFAKAQALAKLIQAKKAQFLSERGQVSVDERTNTLIVQDIAPQQLIIKRLLRVLDVPSPQIMITATLISIDKDSEHELGLQFQGITSGNAKLSHSDTLLTSMLLAKLTTGLPRLDARLSALEQQGRAELISNPKLFTLNQQTASIEAGEEVPYQEVSESGGTAINFKRAVLRLQVTPQLLPGNKIVLALNITQDRPSAQFIQGMPMISTRQIQTQVLIKSGQTLVLGGIYEQSRTHSMRGIPYINRLPMVGWLFRQQQARLLKRELLIFVTPNIIN